MAFGGLFKKKKEKTEEKKHRIGYRDLKVREVIPETDDAISLVFDITAEDMSYLPGQFLTLILNIDGKEVRRAYSLSSSPDHDNYLAVTIKRVEDGLVSNYIPDNIQAGDTIKVMDAMGSFTTEFREDQKRHLIMFAGGSGITPMMSLLKSTLIREPKSVISLIYCNRNEDSIIFREELRKWETRYEGRLHVIHILDDAPMNWQGYSGLLDREILTDLFERIPDWGIESTTYLMCGPEGMMKNVQGLLEEQGIPEDKIFKESFVQGTIDKEVSRQPEAETGESDESDVVIHYDGDTYELKVKRSEFILETALDQGIDLPFSCQSGLCTACRCKRIDGEVNMEEDEGLSESEISEGYRLICVGHPGSDRVELEVG